jgi:hypothetical protein
MQIPKLTFLLLAHYPPYQVKLGREDYTGYISSIVILLSEVEKIFFFLSTRRFEAKISAKTCDLSEEI